MRDLKVADVKIAGCGHEQRMVVDERLHWLDNLRGFAIFFVVLGHIALGNLQAETWGAKYYTAVRQKYSLFLSYAIDVCDFRILV